MIDREQRPGRRNMAVADDDELPQRGQEAGDARVGAVEADVDRRLLEAAAGDGAARRDGADLDARVLCELRELEEHVLDGEPVRDRALELEEVGCAHLLGVGEAGGQLPVHLELPASVLDVGGGARGGVPAGRDEPEVAAAGEHDDAEHDEEPDQAAAHAFSSSVSGAGTRTPHCPAGETGRVA